MGSIVAIAQAAISLRSAIGGRAPSGRSECGLPRLEQPDIEVEAAIRKRQQSGPPKAVGRHDRRSAANGGGK